MRVDCQAADAGFVHRAQVTPRMKKKRATAREVSWSTMLLRHIGETARIPRNAPQSFISAVAAASVVLDMGRTVIELGESRVSEVPAASPRLSLVLPAHNEAEHLAHVVEQFSVALTDTGMSYEIIVVDDGSMDRTWEVVGELSRADQRLRGVRLSRNFGKESALAAGLDRALG